MMVYHARLSAAKNCLPPTPLREKGPEGFSCFGYVETHFPRQDFYPLRRIFSQARQLDAKVMMEEELQLPGEFLEENEDIRKYYPRFSDRDCKAVRLSFFTTDSPSTDSCIGYAILKVDTILERKRRDQLLARVYESVFRLKQREDTCVHSTRRWRFKVNGQDLEVPGFLYAQQNGITKVCAHAALRMATAALDGRGLSYREMNDHLGIDHVAVKLKQDDDKVRGLTPIQMADVLEKRAGLRALSWDERSPVSFQNYIYGSIESGFPSIALMKSATEADGSLHALVFFGHDFSKDTLVPRAESRYFSRSAKAKHLSSELWVGSYLMHDDNMGSNFHIPRSYLHSVLPSLLVLDGSITSDLTKHGLLGVKTPFMLYPRQECVTNVMSIAPTNIMNPILAEQNAADYLRIILQTSREGTTFEVWMRRLNSAMKDGLVVMRPLLIDRLEYLVHVERMKDWGDRQIEEKALDRLREILQYDQRYWMIEISVPELFSANKRKVGEILIKADQGDDESDCFVQARLPGLFVEATSTENEFGYFPSHITGHVPLLGCEGH